VIDWTVLLIICVIFAIPFTYAMRRISKSDDSSKSKQDIEILGKAVLNLFEKVERLEKEAEEKKVGRRTT